MWNITPPPGMQFSLTITSRSGLLWTHSNNTCDLRKPHSRSQQLNILETSLRQILHKNLGITPYKVQLVQELKPIDHPMRFRFAKCAYDRFTEDVDFGKEKKNHLFR